MKEEFFRCRVHRPVAETFLYTIIHLHLKLKDRVLQ
jgi:hypothetical protein